MKKISKILASLAIVLSGVFVVAPVFAADCSGGISDASCNKSCSEITDPTLRAAAGCETSSTDSVTNHALNIVNYAIAAVGIIAVLVIVMGGQRYITSGGDPGKAKQAKDMILYAVIAIVVAVLAFAIVNFVSGAITSNTNTGAGVSPTTTP